MNNLWDKRSRKLRNYTMEVEWRLAGMVSTLKSKVLSEPKRNVLILKVHRFCELSMRDSLTVFIILYCLIGIISY